MPYRKKKQDPNRVGRIVCYSLIVILSFALILFIGLLLVQYGSLLPGFGNQESKMETPLDLVMNQETLTLYVTTGTTLRITPEGTKAEWSTSDKSVATVDENGAVKALNPGKATITATVGSKKAECVVTVIPLPEMTTSKGSSFDEEKLQELRSLLTQKPLLVSIYYRDLETGAVIEYNSGKKYQAGSVTKAPYCKWLMASGADLQEQITLEQKDILEGAGSVKNQPAGTVFTVEQLIGYTITESDNTAYNMLAKRFGFDGFKAYAKSLNISANQSSSNLFGSMSASDAAYYFTDIYQWSQSGSETGQKLVDLLCNTTYRQLISSAVSSAVAHKYGYNNGTNGFHDAAIVYSEHPYVLTIFTSLDPDVSGTVSYIQSIASCVDTINSIR